MPNDYGLFFTRDNTVLRLPVNPEKFPIERENANTEYNVLGLGPITIPRIPKQKQVKISSFFPGRAAPYVLTGGDFKEPEFYIDFFEAAMGDKVPILFTPVRCYEDGEKFMTADPGFRVLVTSFKTEEKGGEAGDFYYHLTLQEYRDYSPMSVRVEKPKAPQQEAKAKPEPTREIPPAQLYVGAVVIANGPYYYSSYGDEPHGTASGRRCKVSHMVTSDPTRAYPIPLADENGGWLGWAKRESLQVVK